VLYHQIIIYEEEGINEDNLLFDEMAFLITVTPCVEKMGSASLP
jgi:hypothetical protein